jgi:hypothetical protein
MRPDRQKGPSPVLVRETSELHRLLDGIKADSAIYFQRAAKALENVEFMEYSHRNRTEVEKWQERDRYWSGLPDEGKEEAKRLDVRLVSLMGQVTRAARNSPLASEADQGDIVLGTKAMRAALALRLFRSWDLEILNDEDVVLGVTPAGQSDDAPSGPTEASEVFAGWADKVRSVLDLVAASDEVGPPAGRQQVDSARYRPGTAFIMMWMDPSKPELSDVSDAVKEVFESFDIRANRADDIEHEGLITERILNEIKAAEFCFADLSGSRPNVYYEVGFAHALSKRVILFRKTGTGLHFDLAGYNCPEYSNLGDLKKKLTSRLSALTNKEPKS